MVARHPATWAAELVHLVREYGEPVIRKPGAREWLQPSGDWLPSDRAAVLAEVIFACARCEDIQKWRESVDAALRMARDLRQSPLKQSRDEAAALLAAISAAIGIHCGCERTTPHGLALFDEIMRDMPSLDLATRKAIMVELAEFVGTEMDDDNEPPRWRQLMDLALGALPAKDAADVLAALLESWTDFDFTDRSQPLFRAVLTAVQRLPDAVATPVLSRLLHVAHSMEDTPSEHMWHALLQAASDTDVTLQASLLTTLGDLIPWYVEDKAPYWIQLADRVAALPPALRRAPLQSLVNAREDTEMPIESAVARLVPMVEELDSPDRAALLSAMLSQRLGQHAASRRMIMNAVGRLPDPYRYQPFLTAASDLLAWADRGPTLNGGGAPWGGPASADASSVVPAPGDFRFSISPSSQGAALEQFHDLLTMLPLRQRGELLTALASDRTRPAQHSLVPQLSWILKEAGLLPGTDRYEVKIYTDIARYAATSCPAVALPMLLRDLVPAVASLSPDQCASAVRWLHEACLKAGMPEQFEPVKAAFEGKMPQEDRIESMADGHRKRKADPEWGDAAGRQ